ncbi:helix-turn-helix transcriptional regulator [Mesorhizobium sp.]|uniref:helix-turn-helix domain-containing protein n=1 Tax=Mesorhizobium sp. TaxID=1871066 RepID=UPI000FE6CF13|nr:helix-turn-helix transcriptional regulator [Mesorhizobium sp.]RWK40892.1 MAG: XRE family transcriptional regulator [Mesorhizobium sp.]RWK70472.1 MAG: XRE family transcriptional regulator [Mesorhizobium sp.]RWK80735.1 MAG: XRE family transcriptional regulator [Mesorhizobium sp.]RWK83291.1 MAG: XRE family transcriptional regulator [Mesorhizobium sp.]RWL09191.1 MAG: XRE family transcriptional regulator [Mesorhizobium sp.]
MAISADDVFAETMSPELIEASDRRTRELLEEYETLQQLRKARSLTQEHVGKKLGKKQVSVAQLEKRSDFLLSTLREYVRALGGELDLVVRFKDHAPVVLAGVGEESLVEVPRAPNRAESAKKKKRSARQAVA